MLFINSYSAFQSTLNSPIVSYRMPHPFWAAIIFGAWSHFALCATQSITSYFN